MANLADLQRANEGRHTWNEWAKAQLQVGATPAVDFSEAPIEATNFGGFIFPGLANFTKAQFQGAASFEGAEFCELASFEKASFLKPAVFAKTSFKQGASFYHTVFHSTAFFVRAVFNEATAGSNDLRNRPVFSGAQFVGDALFSSVIFYAGIAMDRARFEQDARFNGVQFKRFADVTHAEFLKFATFEAANFEGKLVLTGSTFLGETDFTHVSFSDSEFGGVKFEHALTRFASASFKCVPDFRGSIFKTPPSFHNVKVDDVEYVRGSGPPIWHRWIARATSAEDAARFRRLKQLAIDGRDHERELEFFAKELRAKRIHETPGFWSNCLNLAYEFLSDFGRSVARPLLLLLVVT